MIASLLNQGKKPIDAATLPNGVVPRISKRAKRLSLRVDSVKGVVALIIPPHCSNRKAAAFANQHHAWITQKLHELPQSQPFHHGQIIPILGRDRTIKITRGSPAQITLQEGSLIIETRRDDPSGEVKRFLKTLATQYFTPLLNAKAAQIGKTAPTLCLRDTKSRWGSCGSDGRIMLSWRLIFTPPDVMDYVIAHEVAHLRHMNHGADFWSLCNDLCAQDMNTSRQWLTDHGTAVLRIGR